MSVTPNERLRDIDPAWLRKVGGGAPWILGAAVLFLFFLLIVAGSKVQIPSWLTGLRRSVLPGIPVCLLALAGWWKLTTPEPAAPGAKGLSSLRKLARAWAVAAFLWVAVFAQLRLLIPWPIHARLPGEWGMVICAFAGASLLAWLASMALRLSRRWLALETLVFACVTVIFVPLVSIPSMRSLEGAAGGLWLGQSLSDGVLATLVVGLIIWDLALVGRHRVAIDKAVAQRESAEGPSARIGPVRYVLREVFPVTATACLLLAGLGGAAAWWSERQVAELTVHLQDEDPELRKKAVKRFDQYGSAALPVLANLLPDGDDGILRDEEQPVRVARTYGLVRTAGSSAVPLLVEMLNDRNARLRRWGAPPPLPSLVNYRNQAVLLEVLRRCKSREYGGTVLEGNRQLEAALDEALEDEDLMIRYYVTHFLRGVGHSLGTRYKLYEGGIKEATADPDLDAWVGRLGHEDRNVRLWAAFYVGPEDEATIPVFSEALSHESADIRGWAAKQLRLMGPKAAAAVPALRRAMNDEDGGVRFHAADALAEIAEAAAAVPALVQALGDKESSVRRIAASSLGEIGAQEDIWQDRRLVEAAVPPLVERSRSEILERVGPEIAPAVLRQIGPGVVAEVMGVIEPDTGEPIPALVRVLQAGEDPERLHAAHYLGLFGPQAAGVFPALVEARRGTGQGALGIMIDWALKKIDREAAEALARLGGKTATPLAEAIETLEGSSGKGDSEERAGAIRLLAQYAAQSPELIPRVVEAMEDDDSLVSYTAGKSLVKLGPSAVPALVHAMEGSNESLCRKAIGTLGEIGPDACGAVPALVALLQRGMLVREAAESVRLPRATAPARVSESRNFAVIAEALGRIGPGAKEAVPVLVRALDRRNLGRFMGASRALGRIGSGATEAIPALAGFLESKDPLRRIYAANALRRIGWSESGKVVRVLVESLQLKDYHHSAAEALQGFRPEDSAAIPALVETLEDESPCVRAHAADALRRIGWKDHRRLVHVLIESLRPDASHGCAAQALRNFRFEDTEVIPTLVEALEDEDQGVRAHAAGTLRRIGWDDKPRLAEVLIEALGDDQASGCAARALGDFSVGDSEATPVLVEALEDENTLVRVHLVNALRGVRWGEQERMMQVLLDALGNEDTCQDAAYVLGKFGRKAKAAVPALLEAAEANAQKPQVRKTIIEALKRIDQRAMWEAGLK